MEDVLSNFRAPWYTTRMKPQIQAQVARVLRHLYINPLEKCNLACKICYTRKTSPILSEAQIVVFIHRYRSVQQLDTITFCGGEVFSLRYFPGLLNTLTDAGLFIQVITNGTIDVLDQIQHPNSVHLIVSLDGLRDYHDTNRGEGNFDKSVGFLKKAKRLGFHVEVFSIVTRQNLSGIDAFESFLAVQLDGPVTVTYHPRKPPEYLTHHPEANVWGETSGFDFLNESEMLQVMKERNVFPPKDLGCYQIALVSDGRVFGCCEGTVPIGRMDEDVAVLIDKLKQRIVTWEKTNTLRHCLGCSQSEFMCGIKKYLHIVHNTADLAGSLS